MPWAANQTLPGRGKQQPSRPSHRPAVLCRRAVRNHRRRSAGRRSPLRPCRLRQTPDLGLGIRPTFTSRCTMCPVRRAVIFTGFRLFSPPGPMKRRSRRPSRVRCRPTVHRSITKPILTSSSVIRCADHLCSRRQDSICSMTHAGVAFGLGADSTAGLAVPHHRVAASDSPTCSRMRERYPSQRRRGR